MTEGDRESAILFDKHIEISSPMGPRKGMDKRSLLGTLSIFMHLAFMHLLTFSYFVLFSKDAQWVGQKRYW